MADNHSRNSRARNMRADPAYDAYDEDPLVELARIVSEDGGYYNIAEQPEPEMLPEAGFDAEYENDVDDLGINLEGQLMEELELSMASPDGEYQDDYPQTGLQPETEYTPENEHDGGSVVPHQYAPEDAAALSQLSAAVEQPANVIQSADVEQPTEYYQPNDYSDDDHVYAGEAYPATEYGTFEEMDGANAISEQELSDLEHALAGLDDGAAVEPEAPQDYSDDWPEDLAVQSGDIGPEIGVPPVMPAGEHRDRGHGSERRSGRKVFAIAAVLSIAVLGGGVLAMMNSTGVSVPAGGPPVFKADSNPVKVAPVASDDAASEDAVFDVAAQSDKPVREALIDRNETPVRQILPADEPQTEVLRSIGEDNGKNSARLSENQPANSVPQRFDPIGPKQVTTIRVGPDGKIIRSTVDNTGSVAAKPSDAIVGGLPTPVASELPSAMESEPEPTPVTVVDIKSGAASDAGAQGDDVSSSPLETIVAGLPASDSGASTEIAAPVDLAPLPRERPSGAPTVTAGTIPARDDALVAQPARTSGTAPVNLLEAARTAPRRSATAPASTGSTGSAGPLVQLSSQRSEDQARAAFNGLKQRFPSLLGNYQPNIQRADLGDRGVYYRVRVGPMADQGSAVQLCAQLKSAGGSCFVTR